MKTLRAPFLASLPRERLNLSSFRNGIVSLASVPDEKDEFAELGPAAVKSSNVVPKLRTEKGDSVMVDKLGYSMALLYKHVIELKHWGLTCNSCLLQKRRGTTRKCLQLEIGRTGRSDAKPDSSSELLNVVQEKVDSPKFNHGLGSLLERLCFATVADSPPCDMQNASLLGSIGSLEKTDTLQKKCDSHSIKKRRGTTRRSVLLNIGWSGRSEAKLDSCLKPLYFKQENVQSPKFNSGLGSLLERTSYTVVADSPLCDGQNDSVLESIRFSQKPDTLQKKCDSIKKRRGTTRKSALLDIGCSSRSHAKLNISSKPLTLRQENVDSPKLDHGLGSLLERPSSTTVADLPPSDRQNDSLLGSIEFLKKAFQELSHQ